MPGAGNSPAIQAPLIPTGQPEAPAAPAKPADAPVPPAPQAAIPAENPAVAATAKAISDTAAPATAAPAITIVFKTTETTVPLSASETLNKLAKELIQNETERLNIIAYASAAGNQVSTARRISLSRALSVRSFLIDAGVTNLRINVQAEGDKNPGGEADRVDLLVTTTSAAAKP